MLETFIYFCFDDGLEEGMDDNELFNFILSFEEGVRLSVYGTKIIFKLINKTHFIIYSSNKIRKITKTKLKIPVCLPLSKLGLPYQRSRTSSICLCWAKRRISSSPICSICLAYGRIHRISNDWWSLFPCKLRSRWPLSSLPYWLVLLEGSSPNCKGFWYFLSTEVFYCEFKKMLENYTNEEEIEMFLNFTGLCEFERDFDSLNGQSKTLSFSPTCSMWT